MLERERHVNAVRVGAGRDVHQRRDALTGEQEMFAGHRQADLGVRTNVPRPPRDRIGQLLDGEDSILIQSDHELELTAANRPEIGRRIVRHERIVDRRHDRRTLGGHRRRGRHHERQHGDDE